MKPKTPLLIVSDAITGPTGLGRITRELAIRIHERIPQVQVGTCGPGGSYSRKFGFPNYPASISNWTLPELPGIWNDFADGQSGILFFIWNHSWLSWVADPKSLPDGDLKTFILSGPIRRWGYFPIDSEGPNGLIGEDQIRIISSFDRVATYTDWAKDVIDRTSNYYRRPVRVDVLFHGTDGLVFYPQGRNQAREEFLRVVVGHEGRVANDVLLLGCNQTNTPRKDWGLVFETCQELLRRGFNVGLWAHTDALMKQWNLTELANMFGMRDRVIFTTNHLSDEAVALGYAACDVVLCPGSGEGWGLSGSEALACGRAAIHGNYAGQVQYMPKDFLVDPVAFRYDGFYSCKRPVFRASDWADKVVSARGKSGASLLLGRDYLWDAPGGAWDRWGVWLKEGIRDNS